MHCPDMPQQKLLSGAPVRTRVVAYPNPSSTPQQICLLQNCKFPHQKPSSTQDPPRGHFQTGLHHLSIFTKFLLYSQHLNTNNSMCEDWIAKLLFLKRWERMVMFLVLIQLQHRNMYILISTSLHSQTPNRMLKRRSPRLGLIKANFVHWFSFISCWQHMVLNASESYINNVDQFRIGDTIPKRKKKKPSIDENYLSMIIIICWHNVH